MILHDPSGATLDSDELREEMRGRSLAIEVSPNPTLHPLPAAPMPFHADRFTVRVYKLKLGGFREALPSIVVTGNHPIAKVLDVLAEIRAKDLRGGDYVAVATGPNAAVHF